MSKEQISAQIWGLCDQSANYYASNVQKMLKEENSSQLQSVLRYMSLKKASGYEILYLQKFLMQNRQGLRQLSKLLYNDYLADFIEQSDLASFIIFMYLTQHPNNMQTSKIASQVYSIIKIKSLDCCQIYLEILRWFKAAYRVNCMPCFIQYTQKDIPLIFQPFRSSYQSKLNLYRLFYFNRHGCQNVQNLLGNIQIKDDIDLMQDLYEEKLRYYYNQNKVQQMMALKKQLFKLPDLRKVLKIYCCHTIGQLLSSRGRIFQAIEYLTEALTYTPFPMRIRYMIADCYFRIQKWSQVCNWLQYFQMNGQIDQEYFSSAMAAKGRACLSMTKTTKKINLNEKLISTLDQQNNQDQMFENAIYYSNQALKYNPHNFVAHQALGLIQIEYCQQPQKASKRFFQLLKTGQQTFKNKILILLTYSLFVQGSLQDHEMAQHYFQMVPEQKLKDGYFYSFFPAIVKKYRPSLQATLKTQIKSFMEILPTTMLYYGQAAHKANKIDCAIKYFELALQKLKTSTICKLQLAECYQLVKKQDSALKLYKQVLRQTQGLTSGQLIFNKKVIFRNMLQLYIQLLDNNNQCVLVDVKQTLYEIKDVYQQLSQLFEQQRDQQKKSDKVIMMLVKKKLTHSNQLNIYLNLLKIFMKHQLQDFIHDIHKQIKENIFRYTVIRENDQANLIYTLMAFHRGRILCQLARFEKAQKQLMTFLKKVRANDMEHSQKKNIEEARANDMERSQKKNIEQAYLLLCHIYTHYQLQNIPYNFTSFQQIINNKLIQSYEAFQKMGQFFSDSNRPQLALYYLSQAAKLCKSKQIIEKLMQINDTLLLAQVNQDDIQKTRHLLKSLILEFESMIQDKRDYQYAIAKSKKLYDLQLIQRLYQKLIQFQMKNKSNAKAIKLQLVEVYLSFGRIQKAETLVFQLFSEEPSKDILNIVLKVVESQEPLTKQQICQKILKYSQQNTDCFVRAIIYSEFQLLSSSLTEQYKFMRQLKFQFSVDLKKEVDQKCLIVKKFTRNISNLFFQGILYSYVSVSFPKDKKIEHMIRIIIFPQIFRKLGSGNKFFGQAQLKQILQIFGDDMPIENKLLIFELMHYYNGMLKKHKQNALLVEWITKWEEGLALVNSLTEQAINS